VTLTPHPLLVLKSKNRIELSLRAFVACKKGETYLTVRLNWYCRICDAIGEVSNEPVVLNWFDCVCSLCSSYITLLTYYM
jgi:hypothetical protein